MRVLRRLRRWACVAGCAVLCGSCGADPSSDGAVSLEVTPDVLSFGSDEVGVVRRVEVRTDAATFSTRVVYYGEEREWLEVVRDRESVEIAVRTIHRDAEARHAAVTVMASGVEPATISVTQRGTDDATDYGIVLDPASLRLAAAGEETTGVVRVVTSGDGVEAESDAPWCTVRIEADLLRVTAEENAAPQGRACLVAVTNAQGEAAELAVWQAGQDDRTIVLQPDRLAFAASGTELTRQVTVQTTETGLTAQTDAEWIVPYLSGDRLTVTVAENGGGERQGRVTVRSDSGAEATLTVTQQAGAFRLEPAVLHFGAEAPLEAICTVMGAEGSVTAQPDETCADWITATVAGVGVTVRVAPNPTFAPRTGSVRITDARGVSAAVTVEQEAREWVELCGTWSWSAEVTPEAGDPQLMTGTATLAASSEGGYLLTGVAGAGVGALGVTEPVIRLERRGDRLGVVCDVAFEKGATCYYFSGGIDFPSAAIVAWHSEEAFLEVAPSRRDDGGAAYDRLTFAGEVTASPENFPALPEVWGETGTVVYPYYRLVAFGGQSQALPVETLRQVVLEREAR